MSFSSSYGLGVPGQVDALLSLCFYFLCMFFLFFNTPGIHVNRIYIIFVNN